MPSWEIIYKKQNIMPELLRDCIGCGKQYQQVLLLNIPWAKDIVTSFS